MTCCAAINCYNRSEHGVRMFPLPTGEKNKFRRHIWAVNIGREKLPNRAYICETHFTYDQFENNREDGKRPLRWDAVPTIFSHRHESLRKLPILSKNKNCVRVRKESAEINNIKFDSENDVTFIETDPTIKEECDSENDIVSIIEEDPNCEELQSVIPQLENMNKQNILHIKRKLKNAQKEIRELKLENERLRNIIHKNFTKEQMEEIFCKVIEN